MAQLADQSLAPGLGLAAGAVASLGVMGLEQLYEKAEGPGQTILLRLAVGVGTGAAAAFLAGPLLHLGAVVAGAGLGAYLAHLGHSAEPEEQPVSTGFVVEHGQADQMLLHDQASGESWTASFLNDRVVLEAADGTCLEGEPGQPLRLVSTDGTDRLLLEPPSS